MKFTPNKNTFYFIIIAVLIIIILLQKCGGGNEPKTRIIVNTDTIRTVDTTYITIRKKTKVYVPKYETVIKNNYDTIFKIDTTIIVGDYYSTYVYNDSLMNDTLKLHISDSISQNKIKSREIKYSIKFPTINIHDVVIKNKNEFYVGMGIVGSRTGINYFGPELLLRTKSKNVYGVGAGINGNLQPNISLRTYWKVGKK